MTEFLVLEIAAGGRGVRVRGERLIEVAKLLESERERVLGEVKGMTTEEIYEALTQYNSAPRESLLRCELERRSADQSRAWHTQQLRWIKVAAAISLVGVMVTAATWLRGCG